MIEVGSYCCSVVDRPLPSSKTKPAWVGALLLSPSQGADLYALYIWSLVLDAARAEGATVEYRDVHGALVSSNFVFRTSPGRIFSKVQPYTHALINFDRRPP